MVILLSNGKTLAQAFVSKSNPALFIKVSPNPVNASSYSYQEQADPIATALRRKMALFTANIRTCFPLDRGRLETKGGETRSRQINDTWWEINLIKLSCELERMVRRRRWLGSDRFPPLYCAAFRETLSRSCNACQV